MLKKEYLYMLKAVRPEMVTAGPTQRETTILTQHSAHLQQLAKDGVLILAGRTQEAAAIGIVIFRTSSDEEAMAIMNEDPAVANGIMTATQHPYKVAFIRPCSVQ